MIETKSLGALGRIASGALAALLMWALAVILSCGGTSDAQSEKGGSSIDQQHAEQNATDEGSRCTEGPPEPQSPDTPNIRPFRKVECPYGFDELVARVTRLSINKSLPDSVETVEATFGLPKMTTAYDDPRIADYTTILSGKGGWRLLLGVTEAFYPLHKGPPGFEPGLHPKRLHKVEDADLRVSIEFLGSVPKLGTIQCVPVSPIVDALLAAGWQDIGIGYQPPTDGGPRTPIFGHGSKRVSIGENRGSCAQYITLMQGTER